jgi:hypothetical protein
MNISIKKAIGLAAIAVAGYYLFKAMGKKTPEAKPAEGGEAPLPTNVSADGFNSNPTNAQRDIFRRGPVDIVRPERIPYRPAKPCRKEPIYMPSYNAIPNAYDRTVGMPLMNRNPATEMYANADGTQMYASFGGRCSMDLQTTCRCMTEKKERYKMDIPQLP